MQMANNSNKIRFVRCPKCLQLLIEYSDVPLYQCGGCGTALKAKNRTVNGENPDLNSDETQNLLSNSSENVSSDSFSTFSTEPNNTPPSSNALPRELSENELKAAPIPSNHPTENILVDQPQNEEEQTSNVDEERDEMQKAQSVISEEDMMSRCSNAYDGSISSSDEGKINIHDRSYYLQKSRRTFRKKAPAGSKQKEKEGLPPRPPNEKFGMRYGGDEVEEGVSLDSNDFQIIQSLIENDGPHPSLVDKYRKMDRHERLTKMDELREKLNKFSKQRGGESLYHQEGIDSIQRLHYQNQESLLYFDSRNNTNQLKPTYPYIPPPLPPSHCACIHCKSAISRPSSCNLCASSSFPGSPISTDRESARSSSKDRRSLTRKHICRPIFGGTPYVICENCFTLLQVPSTILISKKRLVEMQCGNCSDVLTVPLPSNNISKKVAIDLHGAVMKGDPALNKNYGASSSRSHSTGGESAFNGEGDALSSLHRLMGYNSATELLYSRYDSFESMVPHSRTRSRNT